MKKIITCTILLLFVASDLVAQEALLGLSGNPTIERLSKNNRQQTRNKNVKPSITLPFFDDFSSYKGYPDTNLWADNQGFVNDDYGVYPPTIGVVTLDAIGSDGELHNGISTALSSGDTLTSLPIRLDSVFSPYSRQLTAADSIYLSFYYQPGGGYGPAWIHVGSAPSNEDSLILEFYNTTTSSWDLVWATGGYSLDTFYAHENTYWDYVAIAITQNQYLTSNFQFRFRNYVSLDDVSKPGLLGNCDNWNIDYVYLCNNRTYKPSFRDVAFVKPAGSLLKKYQAMPSKQYLATDMKTALDITITNLYSQPLASHYKYVIYDDNNDSVCGYSGGYENAPAYLPNHTYQTASAHANPPVNCQLQVYPYKSNIFTIVHTIKEGISNDNHPENDTSIFTQVFDNYYAYDDGVPENGYGITTTSNKCWLAYKFELAVSDTLTAIDMYFNKTYEDGNTSIPFYICVWDNNAGKPGTLLYKSSAYSYPVFGNLNQYYRYVLDRELVVNGTVFVGFEQHSKKYINIGFDRNNNSAENIYYLTAGSWQQSVLQGSLMIRPYFGERAIVGLKQPTQLQKNIKIYPNPCKNYIYIKTDANEKLENATIEIYDMLGNLCLKTNYTEKIDVTALNTGVYLLKINAISGQTISANKIIKTK